MSKVQKVAVHEVEYREGRERLRAKPGSIFSIDEEHVARLEKLGAIRDANEAEIALYEKQNKKSAKPKAAVKADVAAVNDADPDVDAGDDNEGASEPVATPKAASRGRGRNRQSNDI